MPLKGNEAEKAAEYTLQESGWTTHRARAHRVPMGGRMMTTSNDLWGCVDLACLKRGNMVWNVQITTSDGVTKRRRKLEKVEWPFEHVRVSIFESRDRPSPVKGKRIERYFRIHDLQEDGTWKTDDEL